MIGQERRNMAKLVNLKLCGENLPWVDRSEHLRHTLHSDGTMRQDIKEKIAQFLAVVTISFRTAYPHQHLYAIEKYCCSWWGLNSKDTEIVYASWITYAKYK